MLSAHAMPWWDRVQNKNKGAAPPPKAEWQHPCSRVRWNMEVRDFVYMVLKIPKVAVCIMHNMPVVSERKLNQVDIVGYHFQLHSFFPSFLPCLLASLLPFFLASFLRSFLPSLLASFLPCLLPSFPTSFPTSFPPSFPPSFCRIFFLVGIIRFFFCFFCCNIFLIEIPQAWRFPFFAFVFPFLLSGRVRGAKLEHVTYHENEAPMYAPANFTRMNWCGWLIFYKNWATLSLGLTETATRCHWPVDHVKSC